MNKSLRIKNLQFRKATYLGEEPKHPSYHIDKWVPNRYYKKEDEYIKEGNYYTYADPLYRNCRIHKDCFKNPEVCYGIAAFVYDDHEGFYELQFIGDRPLELDESERNTFWSLIEYGYKQLNCEDYD